MKKDFLYVQALLTPVNITSIQQYSYLFSKLYEGTLYSLGITNFLSWYKSRKSKKLMIFIGI